MADQFEVDTVDLGAANAYGRSFAEVYDHWYRDVTDAQATADFVARHHPGGLVIELGVGTGRISRPIVAHGLTVIGVDGSAEMLAGLSPASQGQKSSDAGLPVQADLRALPFRTAPNDGETKAGTVLIAFNTIFNLASQHLQQQLFSDVAACLRSDGIFIVEALDVTPLLDGPPRSIGRRSSTDQLLVATSTQLDATTQNVLGQHIEVDHTGVRVRPWALRWTTPTQLDEMAKLAGLTLVERYGDWSERPFSDVTPSHISVYR